MCACKHLLFSFADGKLRLCLQIGTPLCIPTQAGIEIGRIASMELNHKPVDTAKRGESVAMKIEPHNAAEATRLYGRHFDFKVNQADISCTLPLRQS